MIHQSGPNRQRPFLAFDCEAMPSEVLERELFGPDRDEDDGPRRRPRLSLGDGSTLLLVGLSHLPRDLQARLVEALDAPVRLMASSPREPEASLADDRLRPDLYYALTSLVLRLRPLRERLDELPALSQFFLERMNQRGGVQRSGFTPGAIETLSAHDWPGNLPELVRVVEYAHARAAGVLVAAEDLPSTIRGQLGGAYTPPPLPTPIKPLDQLLTEVERRAIETAMRQARSNKSRAAEILGISRPRLYRRIKELNLPDEDEPAEENGPAEL
jgi:DNA-binding NtrC family response regulator